MKTGIVILNYNDYETTLKCLQPILDYKNIDYIIVVDNCSTNDSYDQLAKHRNDRWVLLRSPSNGGYAKGNNLKRVTLDADFRNTGAKSLYERIGFKEFNKKRVKICRYFNSFLNLVKCFNNFLKH